MNWIVSWQPVDPFPCTDTQATALHFDDQNTRTKLLKFMLVQNGKKIQVCKIPVLYVGLTDIYIIDSPKHSISSGAFIIEFTL